MSATWTPTLLPAGPPKEGARSRIGQLSFYRPQTRPVRPATRQYPARSPGRGVRAKANDQKPSRVWGSPPTSTIEHAAEPRRVWRGVAKKTQTSVPVAKVQQVEGRIQDSVVEDQGGHGDDDDAPALAELTGDESTQCKNEEIEDANAEPTASVDPSLNAFEAPGQEESLAMEIVSQSQLLEQEQVAPRKRRIRDRYPKETYVPEKMEWPTPEEEKHTTEKEVLKNAIEWCKSLMPKEIEKKTTEDTPNFEAPEGAEMLLRKDLRMSNLVFIEPAASKRPSKKAKPVRTKETIKHTAETLRVFDFLNIQAPLMVVDIAPILRSLERRLNSGTYFQDAESDLAEAGVGAEEFAARATAKGVESEECLDNAAAENTPRPPLPEIQIKLETLSEKARDIESSDNALREIYLLVHEKGRAIEPFFVGILPDILSIVGNEAFEVSDKSAFVIESFFALMSPYTVDVVMPALLEAIGNKAKPTLKLCALGLISNLASTYPKSIGYELVALVPLVADLTCDAKKEVRAAAVKCMTAICSCTGNVDLEPFLPFVVEAAQSISNTHLCVEKLAGCIFVQSVGMPALAVLLPVLARGLNDRTEEIVRTCCQIVDNMCKLVDDPAELLPLFPLLKPLVSSAVERVADPEARSVAEKALGTLEKAVGKAGSVRVSSEEVLNIIEAAIGDGSQKTSRAVVLHVAKLIAMATNMHCFSPEDWSCNVGFLSPFDTIIEDVRKRMEVASSAEEDVEEDDDGVDLYRGVFALAYGTHTLLRDARMHLKRNRFYGLLGPNQCGKTTLMRAIANEQLEGFPKRSELKSVFVEHEIQDEEVDVQDDGFPIMSVDKPGWWWVMHTCNDLYKMEVPVEEQQVKDLMKHIGFGYPGGPDRAANLENPVTTYSGGWKMKMQLCAAQLMEADVLMLDEPTGHLDVDNIRWLEKWLEDFPGSIICVSHFSPFLDKMCTHIIDFQDRKLKTFKGEKGSTLSAFVEKYPDKKAYFELSDETMQFKFSLPGPLQGVKSRSKVILRMNSVSYTYATKDKPTITDVNLTVSQVSRVAVIGANGAGKTTAIRILVGEMEPTEGTIWKAPGLRMAYVAQHAIHHLQKHLQETPTQYIMWRFAGNEDKESLEFKAEDVSVDESSARSVSWCIDGATGVVRPSILPEEDAKKSKQDANNTVVPDAILERRQRKKDKMYEYRVKWQFKTIEAACWVERDILVKMGYLKIVQREDEKQAAMNGLMTKQLTQQGIETHLRDFGVDAESASHTMISQLSGGMKVKVVLAAAMWQNPHVLILDEPTNYLDREGLGALASAIRDYQGGVVVISHNREFCDSVATEKWVMNKGQLRIEGESVDTGDQKTESHEVQDEIFDGAGNKISVQKVTDLSVKERKREIKELEKKLKEEKKKPTLSEEERWELEDKLAELKDRADDA